jgi:hypothetical protein
MNGLRQDQQALRDRLSKLLDDMKKNGMMPGQRGEKGPAGQGQAAASIGDSLGTPTLWAMPATS